MNFESLHQNWEGLAKSDPFWAVLSLPDRKNNLWDIAEFYSTGQPEVNRLMDYIQSITPILHLGTALDFGCGVGRVTLPLAEYFQQCIGVDVAPTMLQLAVEHQRQTQNCHYVLNQTTDLSLFANNSFDFIYSAITFQNMAPEFTRAYLHEFVRLLKPDGLLIFQVPSHPVGAKQKIKSKLPTVALDTFYRVKYQGRPRMEMHHLPRPQIEALFQQYPAMICLDIQADKRAFADWLSYRYAFTKQ